MARSGFVWVEHPDGLADAVWEYGDRVQAAVLAVAQYFAQDVQNDMRRRAPWTDRTGNARSGLFSQAEAAAEDLVQIFLSHNHTVEYGIWLELANGGRYAVIMQTIEANLPELNRMLREIFRD